MISTQHFEVKLDENNNKNKTLTSYHQAFILETATLWKLHFNDKK
jgi:hypothetical protein